MNQSTEELMLLVQIHNFYENVEMQCLSFVLSMMNAVCDLYKQNLLLSTEVMTYPSFPFPCKSL